MGECMCVRVKGTEESFYQLHSKYTGTEDDTREIHKWEPIPLHSIAGENICLCPAAAAAPPARRLVRWRRILVWGFLYVQAICKTAKDGLGMRMRLNFGFISSPFLHLCPFSSASLFSVWQSSVSWSNETVWE